MKMLEPIKAYCDLVIAPIEKKRNDLLNRKKLSEYEFRMIEKYNDILIEKYKKLEKMIEEDNSIQ